MPRDIDHLVRTHTLARERFAAGKSVWAHRLDIGDIWNDEAIPADERRRLIVARIKNASWYKAEDEFSELHYIVDNLADDLDQDEWNGWWDEFYDWCDVNRVWVATVC